MLSFLLSLLLVMVCHELLDEIRSGKPGLYIKRVDNSTFGLGTESTVGNMMLGLKAGQEVQFAAGNSVVCAIGVRPFTDEDKKMFKNYNLP